MRLDLLGHGLDDRAVAFLHRGERRPDVVLDLLELGAHLFDPVRRGESAISRIASIDALDRVSGGPTGLRACSSRSSARRYSSTEPLVARRDQGLDRLVAREQRDDALVPGRMSLPEARQISVAISRMGRSPAPRRPQASSSCSSIDLRSDAEMRCSLLVMVVGLHGVPAKRKSSARGCWTALPRRLSRSRGRCGTSRVRIGHDLGRFTHLAPRDFRDSRGRGTVSPGRRVYRGEIWRRLVPTCGMVKRGCGLCRGLGANPILACPNAPSGWPESRRRVAQR